MLALTASRWWWRSVLSQLRHRKSRFPYPPHRLLLAQLHPCAAWQVAAPLQSPPLVCRGPLLLHPSFCGLHKQLIARGLMLWLEPHPRELLNYGYVSVVLEPFYIWGCCKLLVCSLLVRTFSFRVSVIITTLLVKDEAVGTSLLLLTGVIITSKNLCLLWAWVFPSKIWQHVPQILQYLFFNMSIKIMLPVF